MTSIIAKKEVWKGRCQNNDCFPLLRNTSETVFLIDYTIGTFEGKGLVSQKGNHTMWIWNPATNESHIITLIIENNQFSVENLPKKGRISKISPVTPSIDSTSNI